MRKEYLAFRTQLEFSRKADLDLRIFYNIKNEMIDSYDCVLCYVSLEQEVDTKNLITILLDNKQQVACPKIIGNEMKFYIINQMEDLELGYYNILEPDLNLCKELEWNSELNYAIIVPGIVFDTSGYRIGYGKGFYDRFFACINKYNIKISSYGLCYSHFVIGNIPKDQYDQRVEQIITEEGIVSCINW